MESEEQQQEIKQNRIDTYLFVDDEPPKRNVQDTIPKKTKKKNNIVNNISQLPKTYFCFF